MGPSVLSAALLEGRGRNPNQAAKIRTTATNPKSSQCLFRFFMLLRAYSESIEHSINESQRRVTEDHGPRARAGLIRRSPLSERGPF
jgi:hypothetical protein